MSYRKVKLYDEKPEEIPLSNAGQIQKEEEVSLSNVGQISKEEKPQESKEVSVHVQNDAAQNHRSNIVPINKQFLHFIETVVNRYLESNVDKQIKAKPKLIKPKKKVKKTRKTEKKLVKKQVKRVDRKSLIKTKTLKANKLTNWIYK